MARKNKNHHLQKIGDVWHFIKMVKARRTKKPLSTSLVEARKTRDRLLLEIGLYGGARKTDPSPALPSMPFGEIAQKWMRIKASTVKNSTLRDYRSAMNYYVLPRFRNVPISEIGFLDIEEFICDLKCSGKRINNILVPIRSLFKFSFKAGLIEKNPMDLVENRKVTKPDIYPLSMEEVNGFLEAVSSHYRNFFVVAFFSGMRFGEMSALKWKNVDFKLGIIRVRETRVRGVEGPPKTKKSIRDVRMLPPVVEALRDQRKQTMGKSEYVFLNQEARPLLPDSVNQHVWKPALKKAGLEPRSLYQTRHTFATLMLDGGELPGWVQRMMGHETLQMIHDRYYCHIKNYQRDDGTAFMENVYGPSVGETSEDIPCEFPSENFYTNFTPNEKRTVVGQPQPSVFIDKTRLIVGAEGGI